MELLRIVVSASVASDYGHCLVLRLAPNSKPAYESLKDILVPRDELGGDCCGVWVLDRVGERLIALINRSSSEIVSAHCIQ